MSSRIFESMAITQAIYRVEYAVLGELLRKRWGGRHDPSRLLEGHRVAAVVQERVQLRLWDQWMGFEWRLALLIR